MYRSSIRHRDFVAILLILSLVCLPLHAADVKEVKLDKAQQEAVDKLRAKGAAVMQIAADTDALAVNLGIIGKQATDTDLAMVAQLPKVQQLDLHNTAVTDAGLAAIADLTSLTHLHLNGTAVTDTGLAHVKKLEGLVYLNLYNTGVTDEGIKNLSGLKQLKRVYLWQTKVTDAGAKSLKSALPEVYVNRGEELALPPPPPPADPKAADPKAKPVAAAAKPVNDKCPVTGKPIEEGHTLVHAGKTVAFCCGNCPETFKKDPDKYVAKIPNFATAAPAAAAGPDIDGEGFIKRWLILGPIAIEGAASDEIDVAQVPDEAKLSPKAGDKVKVKDKELAWKQVKAADYFLDFNELLEAAGTDNIGVYAVAHVVSPDEKKDVTLLMGTNDQGKVFLNGKELSKHTSGRSLEKDADKIEGLTLTKGANIIVMKVINESNNWQGCLRLVDKAGKPVEGLKIAAPGTAKKPAAKPAANEPAANKPAAKKPAAEKAADEKKPEGKPAAKPAAKPEAKPEAEVKADNTAAQPAAAVQAAEKPAKDKPAPQAGNLMKPADDPAHWRLERHEAATATISAAQGAIVFDVTSDDGTDWHVQAFQTPIDLKDNTEYVITFKARADADRPAKVQAGIDVEDYHTIGLDEEITLGKEWKDHEYKFTATDTAPMKNRVGFVLGQAKGKVYVKDLVVKPAK